MIEHVRLHAPDPADVVHDLAVVRQQFAEVHPALAVLSELAGAAEELRVAFDECETLALGETLRHFLAREFVEFGFRFEEFELARRPGHEQIDDGLGLRGEVRLLRRERVAALAFGKHRGECHRPDADRAFAEEVPPGARECQRIFNRVSHFVSSLKYSRKR